MPNDPTLPTDLIHLLTIAGSCAASDLHAVPGSIPCLRVDGRLVIADPDMLSPTADQIGSWIRALTPVRPDKPHKQELKDRSFMRECAPFGRLRITVSHTLTGPSLAVRRLNRPIDARMTLTVPEAIVKLMQEGSGLLVIAGPTGAGKSATLASIISDIHKQGGRHILCLEDPCEYTISMEPAAKTPGVLTRREVGTDLESLEAGLVHALRQDPDIIMLGELRSSDAAVTALAAAETGHLLVTTVHAGSPPRTVDRLIGLLQEPLGVEAARARIAGALSGLLVQHLLPRDDGIPGRVPVFQAMVSLPSIRTTIQDGHTDRLTALMDLHRSAGMVPLSMDLQRLVRSGVLNASSAARWAGVLGEPKNA